MTHPRGQLRIGTSGWQYGHWRGIFYPPDLPLKNWFAFYARHFDTVEVNNTFYRLPQASVFMQWHDQAPTGFLYALKYSRYGTHLRKLMSPEGPIGLYMERSAPLGESTGPILVQLPPKWRVNIERLEGFLAAAPTRRRWAIEFRDASWLCKEAMEVLRRRNAALCIHDILPNHPFEITADWTYIRYHGASAHAGDYSRAFLRDEARHIAELLKSGRDVYAYFNNDAGGHALHNAKDLREMVH